MVLRKPIHDAGTLPYPLSPPPSHPTTNPPPVPNTQPETASPGLQRSANIDGRNLSEQQDYTDVTQSNPWAETGIEVPKLKRTLPTILRVGTAPGSTDELRKEQQLPDAPNWGANDAVTPRSSSESQRSKDFWEHDEDEDHDEAIPPTSAEVRGEELRAQIIVNNADRNTTTFIHGQPSGVKRKPVADANQPQIPATASSPSQDFASNNPFRQPNNSSGSTDHNGAVEDGTYAWGEQPIEASRDKGKGVVRDPPLQPSSLQANSNRRGHDNPFGGFPLADRPTTAFLDSAYQPEQPQDVPHAAVPPHPTAPPPPVPTHLNSIHEHPALNPITPISNTGPNPWVSEQQSVPLPSSLMPGGMVDRVQFHLRSPGFDQGQEIGVVSIEGPPSPVPPVDANGPPPGYEDQTQRDGAPPLPERHVNQNFLEDAEENYPPPNCPPPNVLNSLPTDLLGDPEDTSLLSEQPPQKPPRPNVQSSGLDEATLRKLTEQRNETYQIKHFNWFDHNTGSLRRSSMLTQNKNGPCPLLALVNALILSQPEDSESSYALRAREQVSLGLLIEALMGELTSERHESLLQELPDVDELTRFLLKLHTGMNANPRFVPPERPPPNLMDARNSVLDFQDTLSDDRKPGTFEQTQDLVLYGAFSIPLVHGWLPKRNDPAKKAFARAAPTYEDAQTIQFGEEELEGKLTRGGLTSNEQQLWEDIVSIRKFFATYPTQLTPYGLSVVSESLYPGAFAIMFRNDHFSTMYKHPETGQLFTLVTDAGYADKDEVIWESLVDVSGQRNEFFSGDFRPVGNFQSTTELSPPASASAGGPPGHRQSSTQYLDVPPSAPPLSPQEVQEQHDADFAMALQLQEEEESRANGPQSSARRRSAQNRSSNTDQRSTNIPIRLRSQEDAGPAIPPRNQRNPGVNRPANASSVDDDAPPLYEEAVKGTPYNPPPGHPQHPSSDPSPRSSNAGLNSLPPVSPIVSAPTIPRRPNQPVRVPQQRRMSAFQENAQHYGTPFAQGGSGRGQSPRLTRQQTSKDQDRDCVVM